VAYFLAKTDPETYSIDQFAREKRTTWDGIRNAAALLHLRAMRKGDVVFLYHSGGESAVVGLAKVVSAPRPDPGDPKLWVVDLSFTRRLDPPTTLAEIKASGWFADWALIRQSRLSTTPAPESFAEWMRGRYPRAGL
jgi:predicted RNA-binding protein with PUA-like domain